MAKYWKRSRVTKVLADAQRVKSFAEAEARLDAVRLNIVVGEDQVGTPAGQAAILTAVATGRKCFGRVTLVLPNDVPLIAPLPIGPKLVKAARRLGATIAAKPNRLATHVIRIGKTAGRGCWETCCWWDRWLSGTRAFEQQDIGDSRLAIAGVFAGALAVRQVFACVLAGHNIRARDVSISLWSPWEGVNPIAKGPTRFDVPDKLWLVGLGHLGQGFVWNLCLLPSGAERLAVLQDDQVIIEENEATSLLVLPGGGEMGERKTRVAASWLKACGWVTELIERRHQGDIALTKEDPPYLLSGLDRLEPRLTLAGHGFSYMLDTGLGHGAGDFEGIQLRTIAKGQSLEKLWGGAAEVAGGGKTKSLLDRPAYRELEEHVGQCGTVSFAESSVGVPFVGAAAGALTIAQAIRLASLEPAPLFLQMELGAPEMATLGGFAPAPQTNLGSYSLRL